MVRARARDRIVRHFDITVNPAGSFYNDAPVYAECAVLTHSSRPILVEDGLGADRVESSVCVLDADLCRGMRRRNPPPFGRLLQSLCDFSGRGCLRHRGVDFDGVPDECRTVLMRNNSRFFACLLALVSSALTGLGQSVIKDLSVPEYDAAGNLRWRLKAASAEGTFEDPKLNHGQVELFDDHAEAVPLVGVLSFIEAIYHRTRGKIEGERHIRYRASEGTLDGDGFTYRLSNRHLNITSEVVLESPSARVMSRKADAVLAQNATGAIVGITRAQLSGHVTVTWVPGTKHRFDRAETESAVYTGADGMLELKSPVTTWSRGNKAVINGSEIKIFIGGLPNQRSGSTPITAPSRADSATRSPDRLSPSTSVP